MLRPGKAVLLTLALAMSSGASGATYKPGEVLVKYKDGLFRARASMNTLYSSAGVKEVHHYKGIMKGFEHLVLNDNVKVEDAIAELQRSGTVEYAQPNYILYAFPVMNQENPTLEANRGVSGTPCWFPGVPFPPGCEDSSEGGAVKRPEPKTPPAETIPAIPDPDLAKTYGMSKISAPDAWKIHRGSKDFIVADIDTGVDYNHEDLAFNMWRNPSPAEKKDVVGYDFIHNDGLPFDDHLHGTHTTGTIGAVGGNGVAISGVIQKVSLMALKFLTAEGSGTTADAIKAIDYAITHGAKVLSNSWGGRGDPDNQALYDAIERAKAKDVLFIAAAGNDGTDNDGSDPAYPAAFSNDNLIAVAATDQNDGLAYFSNYGKKTTHVGAPGVGIYSTVPGNKYKNLSGTSMACPHVAGAAALLWSKHPEWNYKKVKEVLLSTVDPLPALAAKTVTGGRINIFKALAVTE